MPVSPKQYGSATWQNGFVAHLASTGRVGVRVFVPVAFKDALAERLSNVGVPQAAPAEARLVRIENGIPRYGDDISERYLVQETQQLHAIHLNKGCYLGQEIVERVRSRGQVHRVLMPLRIHTAAPPPPGTKLRAGSENAGEITSAEFSPTLGEVVALGYIRTEPAHTKPELIVADTDPPITAAIV
jgi:aminomethyltransferase